MNAYPACYLSNAQNHLAQAFHLAVDVCGIEGSLFTGALVTSPIAHGYEMGQPHIIAGMSGVDVFYEIASVLYEDAASNDKLAAASNALFIEKPRTAYWIGWSVAQCQWSLNCRFRDLFAALPYDEFEALYPVYHEMDNTHLEEHVATSLASFSLPRTPLALYRETRGFTQEQLAERAGVGLRSIQMYEQRRNDINKAQSSILFRLAQALGCRMEDLLDQPCQERIEYHALTNLSL